MCPMARSSAAATAVSLMSMLISVRILDGQCIKLGHDGRVKCFLLGLELVDVDLVHLHTANQDLWIDWQFRLLVIPDVLDEDLLGVGDTIAEILAGFNAVEQRSVEWARGAEARRLGVQRDVLDRSIVTLR